MAIVIKLFNLCIELQPEEDGVSAQPVRLVDVPRTSWVWTPLDNFNLQYAEEISKRDTCQRDYLQENKVTNSSLPLTDSHDHPYIILNPEQT